MRMFDREKGLIGVTYTEKDNFPSVNKIQEKGISSKVFTCHDRLVHTLGENFGEEGSNPSEICVEIKK